jgi:hypothetical protein
MVVKGGSSTFSVGSIQIIGHKKHKMTQKRPTLTPSQLKIRPDDLAAKKRRSRKQNPAEATPFLRRLRLLAATLRLWVWRDC